MDRPLLQEAEGKDQDQRASLLSAFYRQLGSHRRRESYDLHVRELLTYVLVNDRDGRGVQLSYDDIAKALCCERRAARAIVDRAEREYGLLAVTESRYQRGGQAPNRYSIDWVAVAEINHGGHQQPVAAMSRPRAIDGRFDGADELNDDHACEGVPGDAGRHGGDAGRHGGDAGRHPFKEYTLSSSLSLTLEDKSAAAKAAAANWRDVNWEDVTRRANQLRTACPSLEREFIWQVCVVTEQLCPGQVGLWLAKIKSGKVDSHLTWLDGCMRGECNRYGCEWQLIRKLVPPCPPPVEIPTG